MLHLPRPQRHLPPRIPEPAALEVAATPVPLRAAATVNVLAGSVLALAALVQLVFAMLAGENLSLSQGDVTLRPNSGAVLIARVAVMLCLGAGGFACWRARLCAKKGEAPDLARACLLGMAGGVLAALPALGSLLGVAFADELDAPVGVWALRLLIMEPFLATPGPPGAWTSVQMSPDLNPLHVLYLWPLGITLVNATARALTPSLSGALQPRDRRKELVWILFFAVAGTLLPFIPTGEGGARSDEVARRYARAVASGGDPMAMHFAWPDCPSELRAASPTNLSQLVPTPDSPVAKVRVMQRTISGPGARTGLAKYRFSYTEQGATNSALWMIIQVEVTLQDGSTREAVLALSQYGGEWRVAPPRKRSPLPAAIVARRPVGHEVGFDPPAREKTEVPQREGGAEHEAAPQDPAAHRVLQEKPADEEVHEEPDAQRHAAPGGWEQAPGLIGGPLPPQRRLDAIRHRPRRKLRPAHSTEVGAHLTPGAALGTDGHQGTGDPAAATSSLPAWGR